MPSSVFPSQVTQALSALVHVLGIAILSHCLSRRLATEKLFPLHYIQQMSLARAVILFVFLDSWFFAFSSSVLVFGVGLETTMDTCKAGGYLCSLFYATSKALIYWFLVEKMRLVWEPVGGRSRLKSPIYMLCIASMSGYLVLFVLLLVLRTPPQVDERGICLIGTRSFITWSIFAFDLYVNILLTALFVIPLWGRSCKTNPVLRAATRRTLVAAVVSLSVSSTNILILSVMNGVQQGWLCLSACTLDVIINALAVFWVTTRSSRDQSMTEVEMSIPTFKAPSNRRHARQRSQSRVITERTEGTCEIFVTMDVTSDGSSHPGDQTVDERSGVWDSGPSVPDKKPRTSDQLAV